LVKKQKAFRRKKASFKLLERSFALLGRGRSAIKPAVPAFHGYAVAEAVIARAKLLYEVFFN
jgi:hypothetical protein